LGRHVWVDASLRPSAFVTYSAGAARRYLPTVLAPGTHRVCIL